MLSMALELGPRAGDVLSLKIRDLNLTHRPATATFHRRHDDKDDPRKLQPVLKTKPRVLTLSDQLALALEHWIDKVRNDRTAFPNARKHPYLFTNGRGDPLSQRGYQLVYERLRTAFPALGHLTSHGLRYDWNDRWTEMVTSSGQGAAQASREQCYAMGWSDRSSMPAKYARRAIADSANKRLSTMHAAAEERAKKHRKAESGP
jgi:integrase